MTSFNYSARLSGLQAANQRKSNICTAAEIIILLCES